MSLPTILETMTPEEFEAHMKQAGSSVYFEGENGVEGIVHYDHGYPTQPWTYDYFGDCGKKGENKEGKEECKEWVQEPYIRRFPNLYALCFWLAFVGLEYA